MKILVFTEGTVLIHTNDIHDFKTYIPLGKAVEKLQLWQKNGATIYYLTSRTEPAEIEDIRNVLRRNLFPDSNNLLFRKENEQYKDVAEQLMPDIFIEDDCASIGGEVEMTYPHIRGDLKIKIKSIIVKEFSGIDHLPNDSHKF